MRRLRIGYIPLLDAALLHVAARQGFADRQGLAFDLVRETSWANIRDKLALGIFDAAHMLAPAAIASSLGLGHFTAPLVAPIALGLDGNAITISLRLHAAILDALEGDARDPATTARALASVIAARQAEGLPPLALAHVFPYSTHHYQLRLWLAAGGIDADRDLRLLVVPPPFMAESLGRGLVDGFCVGAPWNSIAEEKGVGRVLHAGSDIVRDAPEKVLAFRAETRDAEPALLAATTRAVVAASHWAADPANRVDLADLLARDVGFDLPAERILAILERRGERPRAWLRLDPDALPLTRDQADWIFERMVEAGQVADEPELRQRARAVYGAELGSEEP